MKTNIEKTFHVDEPIAKVWENLSDPARIVTCVPGASLTEQMDEDNFKGEVTLKFGPVKASYNGQITFQERNAETRHMQLLGKGLDSKGKGSADMLMNGKLVEKDGGTEVTCSMEVTITGMLAQFGSRLITDVSNSVFDQFVDNFKAKLAGGEVDNTLKAGSMMGSVVKGILGKK
ncbi:MAG TPA: SRPBCC family protein [Saprospiraceae bacterium]|nr:SRPBCC family protein [Lewinellaceae bacterium]HQU59246.1 SRPBCC family protein [Saprospiraceae bacterium]